jgi:hypothetical protein
MGILSDAAQVQARYWAEAHREIAWRTLEKTGRLRLVLEGRSTDNTLRRGVPSRWNGPTA